ncbi:MAG TPA: hypothetical protein VMT62_12825 [Syntrophorhabdaceae bacterium]|nr:hypothetical protein [Syntrophorhabdaceae bacterium]
MKRVLVVCMALLLTVMFAGAAMAQGDAGLQDLKAQFQQKMDAAKSMEFEGTVLSHDVLCHCFVVKGAKGNVTLQDDYTKFDQEYNRAKGLKIGAKVKGEYKSVNYLNYATSVSYVK